MRWLARPEGWDRNGGDGPSGDKRLARVQFAAALAEAVAVGRVGDRSSLLRAAVRLAEDQAEDGSWRLDEQESLGSPATYGVPLATFTALRGAEGRDPAGTRFRDAIARADRWLARREPGSTLDAAAGLLALGSRADPAAASRRRRLLDFLRAGRSDEGGWGPYRDSPPEPFDTAVVLLAIARKRDEPGSDALIRGGRAYLISTQLDDGSWPETTRPPGGESYAQRVSTTAWSTRALLGDPGRDIPMIGSVPPDEGPAVGLRTEDHRGTWSSGHSTNSVRTKDDGRVDGNHRQAYLPRGVGAPDPPRTRSHRRRLAPHQHPARRQ